MVNAIIMASGYSKRMGHDKLLMRLNNKPIIEHVIDTIKKCDFNDIILVAREKEVINIGNSKGIKVVENHEAYKGQSESVKLGIKTSNNPEAYMFFTGDQPFIDESTINLLLESFIINKEKIIIPIWNGQKGTPVIFPSRFRDELLNLEGDEGGRSVIRRNLKESVFVKIENNKALIDIDTPEEYRILAGDYND